MNWKRWKLGLAVATFLSAFVAGAALSTGGSWKTIVAVFCSALLTNWGSWLKEHPIEQISNDTTLLPKP
jgi:Trk-type K+ transport system membrane component